MIAFAPALIKSDFKHTGFTDQDIIARPGWRDSEYQFIIGINFIRKEFGRTAFPFLKDLNK